jgi:hypothetical protein
MKTQYENKGHVSATPYAERLCICTVISGKSKWMDPVPCAWGRAEVLRDMLKTWGSGHLVRVGDGWEYVTDDPNAKERRHGPAK